MKYIFSPFIFSLLSMTAFTQELKQVKYNDGSQTYNGLVTSNAGSNLPGVLILPAWKGIDQESRTAAAALEKEGYIAFIADIYGENNIPQNNNAAAKASSYFKENHHAYQDRIKLALEQLKKEGVDENKIAVIGYCFGGTGALEAARANFPVTGVVCIHGGLNKDKNRPNEKINTKVLVEHPAEDQSVSPEVLDKFIKEMNESQADWQLITYAYCKHTFTNPESPDYNEIMAHRAWKHTLLFLEEVLNK